ncbi:MAG: UvrD-helicase domain-containing protein, partial [Lachnospiraceae bacterium]
MYGLSETQKKAVEHVKGPALILAGPGSGKTTVITQRTKTLIEKYG